MYLATLTQTVNNERTVFNYCADYARDINAFADRIVDILGMPSPEDNNAWTVTHGNTIFNLDLHDLTSVDDPEYDLEEFISGLRNTAHAFNQERAFKEGWCIAECSGSSYTPEGWLEIQNLDEADIFEDDWSAQAWVANLAANESEYHRQAIRYMEAINFANVRKLQAES